MEDQGIVAIKSLITGIKDLGIAAKEILKDGKVGIDDIPALVSLLSKQDELVAAFGNIAAAEAKVKDLNLDEVSQVIGFIIAAAKEVQAA